MFGITHRKAPTTWDHFLVMYISIKVKRAITPDPKTTARDDVVPENIFKNTSIVQ